MLDMYIDGELQGWQARLLIEQIAEHSPEDAKRIRENLSRQSWQVEELQQITEERDQIHKLKELGEKFKLSQCLFHECFHLFAKENEITG